MPVPVPRPDLAADDFTTLARHLADQDRMTLVYAPSNTTITHAAPAASPAPVEVRMLAPAGPVAQAATVVAQPGSRFTLGEVVAYSGATLMGGGVLSGLVSALLAVPMLVPLLSGVTVLVGMLAAIGGAMLDGRERGGAA